MANSKLSPTEAHEILRRHAGRLVSREGSSARQPAWRVRAQTYLPGDWVLPADAHARGLGLVVRGHLAMYAGLHQEKHPLAVLTPGRTFGQVASVPSPADATLTALSDCEIWFLVPGSEQDAAGLEPAGVRTAQRASRWTRLVPVVLFLLAVVLVLALPSGRSAAALLPMGLGEWCHRQAHEECAEQAWKGAALLAPADETPSLALGVLYLEQGKVKAAERAFDQARQVAPDSAEAHNNLGVVYYRRGEYERAADAFRQALLAEPGSAASEQNLGDSLLASHAYEEALNHYRAAVSLEEPGAGTLANMAIAFYQTGRLEEAGEAARSALGRRPDLASAYLVLGAVSLELEQPEEALQLLLLVQEPGPDEGSLDYYLGRTYLALGQTQQAESSFGRALATIREDSAREQIEGYLAAIH